MEGTVQAWPRVIELEAPIFVGEEEITSLSFPEPQAKHVRRTGGNTATFGLLMSIAADWNGRPPAAFKALSAQDANRVLRLLQEVMAPLEGSLFDPETMEVPKAPLVLELAKPFEFGKRQVTQLTIKHCRASAFYEMPATSNPTFGDFLEAGSRLVGEPPSLIDRLSLEDGITLVRTVRGFFHAFQGI